MHPSGHQLEQEMKQVWNVMYLLACSTFIVNLEFNHVGQTTVFSLCMARCQQLNGVSEFSLDALLIHTKKKPVDL